MYAQLLGQGLRPRAQAYSISIVGLWMICLVAAAASQNSYHLLVNDSIQSIVHSRICELILLTLKLASY